jgi:hypothetical protein
LKIAFTWLCIAGFLPVAVIAQPVDLPSASDRCPQSVARTCSDYDGRFCIAVFYFRGDPEFAGKTALGILDNVAEQAKARRPSKIEITSHFMDGVDDESKKLAKQRTKNVVDALIQRGVSAKLIKVKSPKQLCVARDEQVKQRRVEMVFIPEKKRK